MQNVDENFIFSFPGLYIHPKSSDIISDIIAKFGTFLAIPFAEENEFFFVEYFGLLF